MPIIGVMLIVVGVVLAGFDMLKWAFPFLVIGFFILLVTQCSQSVSDAQSEIDVLNLSNAVVWRIWR